MTVNELLFHNIVPYGVPMAMILIIIRFWKCDTFFRYVIPYSFPVCMTFVIICFWYASWQWKESADFHRSLQFSTEWRQMGIAEICKIERERVIGLVPVTIVTFQYEDENQINRKDKSVFIGAGNIGKGPFFYEYKYCVEGRARLVGSWTSDYYSVKKYDYFLISMLLVNLTLYIFVMLSLNLLNMLFMDRIKALT